MNSYFFKKDYTRSDQDPENKADPGLVRIRNTTIKHHFLNKSYTLAEVFISKETMVYCNLNGQHEKDIIFFFKLGKTTN